MAQGLIPAGLEASTRIYPSVIHVGDTVTVAVTAKPGEGVETPKPPAKVGEFDLLGVSRGDSSGAAIVKVFVTSFETGNKVLPSIAVPVRSGGRIDSLRTPEYRISIESLLPADTTKIDSIQIHEAKAPIDMPQHFLWGVFFGYVLVLTALAGLGYLLVRKLMKKPAELPSFVTKPPPRPAELVALDALDAIAAKGYVARGLYKEHYTEVMDVVRGYIEGRFGVEALDRTSWELVQALLAAPVDVTHRSRIEKMLEEADLVKFAKMTPQSEPALRFLDDARRWVKETTPVTPATPAVSAESAGSSDGSTPPPPPSGTAATTGAS